MAQGMGGMMDLTGMPDGPPTRVGVAISDIFTGCYSVIGILAALTQREKTGKGCYVDTALVDSTVGVLANQALNYLVSERTPEAHRQCAPNIVPYQEFPVADGYIIVATGNDNQYIKFCNVLGAPELGAESGIQGQCRPAETPRRTGRQIVSADQAHEARRPAGKA